jgi:hypothetical protein
MRNARRAISGRADGSVRDAGAAGIELGAELLMPAATAGMGELGGDRAVRAISAGQEVGREQRAMAEVLAVQSESETLTAAAQRASVAEKIADPGERARALLLLDRIDRDRASARNDTAAAQLDARAGAHRGRVLAETVQGEETVTAANASTLVESASPTYAARVLDRADRRELGKWEQDLPREDRAGLAPIAEHMKDPLRAASVRVVEDVLQRVPADHRAAIGNVNRVQSADRSAAGYAWRDSGTALLDPAFDEGPARMSESDPLAARTTPSSWLEDVVTHEIGHRVGHRNKDELHRGFFATSGLDAGRTPTDVAPSGDRWDYARTGDHEYFAEMYSSAVNSPSTLYREFVSEPQRQVRTARRRAKHADGHDAARALRSAKDEAASRAAQWRFMREQVFGVNDAIVAQRAAQLMTDGANGGDRAAAFSRETKKVMTPHQLEALYRRHAGSDR